MLVDFQFTVELEEQSEKNRKSNIIGMQTAYFAKCRLRSQYYIKGFSKNDSWQVSMPQAVKHQYGHRTQWTNAKNIKHQETAETYI